MRQVAGIVATITEQKVPSAVFGAKTLLFLFHLGKVPKMLASLRAGINMSPDLQSWCKLLQWWWLLFFSFVHVYFRFRSSLLWCVFVRIVELCRSVFMCVQKEQWFLWLLSEDYAYILQVTHGNWWSFTCSRNYIFALQKSFSHLNYC